MPIFRNRSPPPHVDFGQCSDETGRFRCCDSFRGVLRYLCVFDELGEHSPKQPETRQKGQDRGVVTASLTATGMSLLPRSS